MISGHAANFHPFAPRGWGNPLSSSGTGVLGAAASIFFAYVGFDAVSTAAEETKNPQRNVPIGLIGSLLICTVFYLLVAGGVVGAYGAQPLIDRPPVSPSRKARRSFTPRPPARPRTRRLVCSKEALAYVMRQVSNPMLGNLVGLAATIALPSVVLLMMYGQTRVFFVMARDGLLPERLSAVHPQFRTPLCRDHCHRHLCRHRRGLPPGRNARRLFECGHLVRLRGGVARRDDPAQEGSGPPRPFRTPALFVVAPLSIAGCVLLFLSLNIELKLLFLSWTVLGLVIYFLYGYRHSHVARGVTEVPELAADAPGSIGIAPMPGAPVPPDDRG